VSDPVSTIGPVPKRRPLLDGCGYWILGLVILFIVFGMALGPMPGGIRYPHQSQAMQMARMIGLAMFSYSNDNDGNYPDGQSSTEVFQKLVDGGYISDFAYFYLPLPGKIKPVAGQKLKPENICWDMTSGVDKSSPEELPVVFITGYKINYTPGGTAVALPRHDTGWFGWLESRYFETPGIAVCYKNNTAMFKVEAGGQGLIQKFVSPAFYADGKTYRQLTPEGPLP